MNRATVATKNRKWVWLAGLFILSIISLALWNSVNNAREVAMATKRRSMLKIIGTALHNYHDAYGTFPPAYVADEHGKPMHSWRVLILPYLGDAQLYEQYDFSEPWDGPNNIRLLEHRPVFYGRGGYPGDEAETLFAAIVGRDCVFAGADSVGRDEIPDGISNTIMVGQVEGLGIPWTAPRDIQFDQFKGIGKPGGFQTKLSSPWMNFLLSDGFVKSIRKDAPTDSLRAWFTRNGDDGELLYLGWRDEE